MKIQNNFIQGKVNKDIDERLVPAGVLIDAENFMVVSEDGGSMGVGKLVLGNTKVTNLNIVGAEVIGSISDDSNERAFYWVCGTNDDYLLEYNSDTNAVSTILKSSKGVGLNLNASYRITHSAFLVNSENEDTLLCFTDGYNPPRIVNIDRFKALFVSNPGYVFTSLEISVIKPSPKTSPTLEGVVDIENVDSNEMEDRFISFCYRYKYSDGFYSAISQWSEYFFYPGQFGLNFETMNNLAMVNNFNAVNISFNTGDRDVIGVDLFFKNSLSPNIYTIDKFLKSEENWSDNQEVSILFSNNKVYSALPESEYYRNFDNVPLVADALCVAGNRLMFGNYIEGRNLTDATGKDVLVDFSVSLDSRAITSKEIPDIISSSYYTISGTSVLKQNTDLDFEIPSYVDYKKGSSIVVKFYIGSTYVGHEDNRFKEYYTFLFVKDYLGFSDFFVDFKAELELFVDTSFESTMKDAPAGYTFDTSSGFKVTNPIGKKINIQIPAFSYIKVNVPPIPDDYIYEYFETTAATVSYKTIGVVSSLKSNRSYEVAMYYEDAEGRKTTALTSEKNTLYIPASSSDNKNTIVIDIPSIQKPPSWASRYGFAIKQNRRDYESIYVTQFFSEGNRLWILLKGQTKDKLGVGDELIVKRDKTGVLDKLVKTRVLSLLEKTENFISGNTDVNGSAIIEPYGLYAELDGSSINYQYSDNEFIRYYGDDATVNGRPDVYITGFAKNNIPIEIKAGSSVTFSFNSDYHNEDPRILFNRTYIASTDYVKFEDFFNSEIEPLGFISTSHPDRPYNVSLSGTDIPTGVCTLHVEGTEAGNGNSRNGFVKVTISLRVVTGLFIFETLPIENDSIVYFETPESYEIINGGHQFTSHALDRTFNCYSFGNGAESHQIEDSFNKRKLAIDFCPTSVTSDKYKQVRRYADITYSGVYQSSTSVNKLNEFNLSTLNYKDDIEKRYGPIRKLAPTETDLLVIQEDKWSKVLYGKDLLYNTDATTNLSRSNQVLAQQVMYAGEYGISFHSESFDEYGNLSLCSDSKRGVILKLGGSGIEEISSQGMTDYFKTLFKENKITNVIGQYDSFYDIYLLNIKYLDPQGVSRFVTWAYSDLANGFATRQTFNPEDMLRINNNLISFKNGEVYKHNYKSASNYSTFYGVPYESSFAFNFSQEPSTRKSFKTIEIEGTDSWDITLKTDLQKGYINKVDLQNKEGVWYGYVRGEGNNAIDTSTLSVQGLGVVSLVSGNSITINGFSSELVSIGDFVLNTSLVVVGVITGIIGNQITVNVIPSVSAGEFLISSKPQSIETSGLLGYYMRVDAKINKNTYSEVYSVNSEVSKSYS
jgi:hypothetical protein